ncbi:hypothetical protein C8039_02395 [Halogeometricum sp. wsp3]|nr:hypothetical protein C8039_02395 [Halogeometricum sp. wsp3]
MLVRASPAFQASTVNIRLLDDLVIQSVLLILGPFALVRFIYTQRLSRIEDATSDLLERSAILNEAGMTVVEPPSCPRRTSAYSQTNDRIWADIGWARTSTTRSSGLAAGSRPRR